MAISFRKRSLLYKIESSYAGSTTPTGSANYLRVRDLSIEPIVSDEVERAYITPYFGNYDVELVNKRATLSFSVELSGSGTAGTAPKFGDLLKACSMTEAVSSGASVTYTPNSTATSSVCFYVNYGGVRHIVKGARGSFALEFSVGEIPVINFSFTGLFSAPADASLPTITESNQATPLAFTSGNTSAFQLFSYAGALQSWSLDMANEVNYRNLVGGTESVEITDRKPSGSATVEAVALGTHNFFTDSTGSTTGNNTFLHGSVAGNKCTISAPQTDLGAISYEESAMITMLNLPFRAVPTATGNNEISIAFT
jgi:hypothetical protein